MIIVATILILLLMFIGIPISISFLFGSIFYLVSAGDSLAKIAPIAFTALNNFSLLALPLFMIAGNLMEVTGIASALINFGDSLVKRFKGGMGTLVPLVSMFFGALCGSGTATVATLGVIMLPKLTEKGWDKRYTSALLAASGPLGYMIPPNINAILYAVVSDASVAALFLATILPGIVWGGLLMITNRLIYRKYNPNVDKGIVIESVEKESYLQEVRESTKGMIPAIIMPIIIFGGIYGGIFTPTEAGAVSCIYAIIVGIFYYKNVNFKNLFSSFKQTGILLGSFLFVLPMVMVFTRFLVINRIPQTLATAIMSVTTNKNIILLLMDIIYFITGFFLDAGILIMIITPLMLPVASAIGLSVIQMGVILMVAVGIGTLTPPMAMSLYVIADISKIEISDMVKPLIPFVVVSCVVLLLVTYCPSLSLLLPKIIMGLPY